MGTVEVERVVYYSQSNTTTNSSASCRKEDEVIMNSCRLPEQVAAMANPLYHSLQGQYFVGYADNMLFEKDKNAWAMLYNPPNSGVNLFVNVWTVTDLSEPPLRIQLWFNSMLPGEYIQSKLVSPANTAICPLPKPKIRLLQASNVIGSPEGGVKPIVRRLASNETMVSEDDGKFIFPPGGNFALFLSKTEGVNVLSNVRVSFGWWEEKICSHQYELRG